MPHWISETAHAKINLALHVLGRRNDGYHELDSIVAFANIGDDLRIETSDQLTLNCVGPFADHIPLGADNIILKAWHILQALGVSIPKVSVELTKNLPVSSGIGGGSADAAAMLRALLRMTNSSLTSDQVKSLSRSLGADVPVCFYQKPCHMQGIGETITPLEIELPCAIVLVNPLRPCSTADVFRNLGLANGASFADAISMENPPIWRNDLSAAAQSIRPEITAVLAALRQEPCFSAVRMSGSGATCFGLAASSAEANAAWARLSVKNPNWWVRAAEIML